MVKSVHLCDTCSKFTFAALGYVPIKVASQIVHLMNVFNAVRLIRLRTKQDKQIWSRFMQQYIAHLNFIGLDCKYKTQKNKLQIGLASAACLFYLICSGSITTMRFLSWGCFIDIVFGVLGILMLASHH